MRKTALLLVTLTLLCSLQGCDWIRSKMGMPTAKELQAIKEQRIKDSLDREARIKEAARLEQMRQDSLAKAQPVAPSLSRYHVVLGSFLEEGNAQRMLTTLPKYGYKPQRIDFYNGFAVISAFQTESLREAYNEMYRLTDLDITPYDVWIYDTNQKLHK